MSLAVIVFAKVPLAGQAKTRLAPALGAGGAAALAERMLVHAVAQAAEAVRRIEAAARSEHGGDMGSACSLEVCVSPDGAEHPAISGLASSHPRLRRSGQGEGDLGQRMARALERALRTHRGALLMGTDAPALDALRIAQAGAALRDHDAVFVPALDGGYVLVGLARPCPELFAGMAWSTPQVMQHTRERAARAGLRMAELEAVADIDEPADLVHLPPGWRQDLAPHLPSPTGEIST